MENNLKKEKSLYLVRHSTNPVAWQPWGENAFTMAKNLNRPIFLSIGYSSCHWCRVMEKESFEKEEIAEVLNNKFVPIKMDKDEFPDVDKEYQFYMQTTGESGGWPLSVFLDHNKEPFFAGTYFPPTPSYGRPAFKDLLNNIYDVFTKNHEEVDKVVANKNEFLSRFYEINIPMNEHYFSKEYRVNEFIKIFDTEFFGFREGPKFPSVAMLLYLYENADNETVKHFLINTANTLCISGINDHLLGGFFRYTVDRGWTTPHFEKMLIDNALIVEFLTKMFELTNNQLYLYTARKTIDFVLYSKMNTSYGLLDSFDADSENADGVHEEGYFYKVSDRDFSILEEKELKNIPNEISINDGVIYLKYPEYSRVAALGPTLEKIGKRIEAVRTYPEVDNKAISAHNFQFCSALLSMYEQTREEFDLEQALALYHKLRHIVVNKDNIVYRGIYAMEEEINKYIIANQKNGEEADLGEFIINHVILQDQVNYLDTSLRLYTATKEEEFLNIAKKVVQNIETTFVQNGIPYLNSEKRIRDTFDDDKLNPIGLYLYLLVKYSEELGVQPNDDLIEFALDRVTKFPTGHPTMLRAITLLKM